MPKFQNKLADGLQSHKNNFKHQNLSNSRKKINF